MGATLREGPARRLRAQRVEVSVLPRRLPPAARLHPLLTLFVSEKTASSEAPALSALFALLDQAGPAELRRRSLVDTSWHLTDLEPAQVALRLEVREPAAARGVVEVVMDAAEYQKAWELIRGGRWVGITSKRRLHPHADGSAHQVDEAFAASIPLDAGELPPELAAMARG